MRCWVEVSRARIAANFRAVVDLVGPEVEVMPVVKAEGYGHGAAEVSRVLEAQGARWLAVSNVEEGVALRQAGIRSRILVMADVPPYERVGLAEFGLTPVIHSLEDLRALPPAFPYHLKLDTGLSRMGTRAAPEAIVEAVRGAPARLEGLMTHIASASDFSSRQTEAQIARFLEVRRAVEAAGLAPTYFHLAGSAAIGYYRPGAWQNMVRPGLAIYGYVSPPRGDAPRLALEVKPALAWKAAVLAVRDVPAGALVGYGGLFRAERPMRIAVLAAGYADGYPHQLSNRGHVILHGRLARLLGAVSMDLLTVDATEAPEVKPGDAASLVGSDGDASLTAEDLAQRAGVISYSVLCGITARVRRTYV